MMEKTGKQGITCTWCQNEALQDTDPPACADHLLMNKQAAAAQPATLKELEREL